MPLQLREYQKNDFIALKNIIRKTWRYDEFSSPKTASRLADVFLSSCLTNYTFSRVAVQALYAGAFALVVGGAITRPAEITARYTAAINNHK